MLTNLRHWTPVLFIAILSTTIVAQDSIGAELADPSLTPSLVNMIGDDEELQTILNTECADILVQIEGMNMSKAYTVWLSMLSDLEQFAIDEEYNINGLKLWLNVYWHPDGSIRQIIFFPKPNSRNIDFQSLLEFMNKYAHTSKLPVTHTACFSHYGSANFPTFYDQLLKKD